MLLYKKLLLMTFGTTYVKFSLRVSATGEHPSVIMLMIYSQ